MLYPDIYIVPPIKLKGIGDCENPAVFASARSVQKVVVVNAKRDEHTSLPKNIPTPFMMSKFHARSK